jgi:hypothetical protein
MRQCAERLRGSVAVTPGDVPCRRHSRRGRHRCPAPFIPRRVDAPGAALRFMRPRLLPHMPALRRHAPGTSCHFCNLPPIRKSSIAWSSSGALGKRAAKFVRVSSLRRYDNAQRVLNVPDPLHGRT